MDVHIDNLTSTVRVVDSNSLLSPQVMQQIIQVVLQAVEENNTHQRQLHNERRVTAGVTYELGEEDR